MSPRHGVVILALVAACLLPRAAAAQLQFAGDAPRIYTIEPRAHRYAHELTLGVGFLPLDAFYFGVAPDLSYTYRFTPTWAWEVVHGFYSFSFDTPLAAQILPLGAAPSEAAKTRMRFMISTDAMVRPLHGKLALFNTGIAQADLALVLGVGIANTNVDTRFAVNLGASVHLWATRALAVRLDLRDYVVIGKGSAESVLTFGASGAFDFNIHLTDPDPLPLAGEAS